MNLDYAIEVLQDKLDFLNTPLEEDDEDDLIGGVLNFRQTHDLKIALKILKEFKENSKLVKTP